MSKYTPGRLTVNTNTDTLSAYAICAEQFGSGWGSSIAVATQRDGGRHPISHEQALENARRLVACWNVCEGMSTEELEALAVKRKAA